MVWYITLYWIIVYNNVTNARNIWYSSSSVFNYILKVTGTS